MQQNFQLCICTNHAYFLYAPMTVLICKKTSNSLERKKQGGEEDVLFHLKENFGTARCS